jgi:hypothetical protein
MALQHGRHTDREEGMLGNPVRGEALYDRDQFLVLLTRKPQGFMIGDQMHAVIAVRRSAIRYQRPARRKKVAVRRFTARASPAG